MKSPWFIRLAMSILRRNIGELSGLENLLKDKNYIIASNHQSYLDPVFLQSGIVPYTKKRMYSITKEELKKKFGSLGAKYLGMIYIDTKDKAKCLDVSYDYLKKGEVMCVFPEGRRNFDPENLIKGKTGAARLALRAKVPIIPVGVFAPPGKGVFESFVNVLFPRKKARIKVGKPMYFDRYYDQEITKEILNDITRQVMLQISKLCGKKYPF